MKKENKKVLLSTVASSKWYKNITSYQKKLICDELGKDLYVYRKVYINDITGITRFSGVNKNKVLFGYIKLSKYEDIEKLNFENLDESFCSFNDLGAIIANDEDIILREKNDDVDDFIKSLGRMNDTINNIVYRYRTENNSLYLVNIFKYYPSVDVKSIKIYKDNDREFLAEPHRVWGTVLNYDNKDTGIPLIDEISIEDKKELGLL